MERQEALEALSLLRRVVEHTRDDTALQNWGAIWMLHAFTNGAGFVATQLLLWRGYATPPPYLALWLPIIAFNLGTIRLLRRRQAGARSFVETQIWAIWTAFVVAVASTAFLNYFMGIEVIFLGPVTAVLAAVAFSNMGSIMGRHWFWVALVFLAGAVAMALFPSFQFLILGAVWAATKLAAGYLLHRARRQRLAAPPAAQVV